MPLQRTPVFGASAQLLNVMTLHRNGPYLMLSTVPEQWKKIQELANPEVRNTF